MAASGDPFVAVSVDVMHWAPLAACSLTSRLAWIAMLTSREMRRACPGLFPGSVAVVADVSRLPFGDAVSALDELVAQRLVEHDATHRLIRFTRLPDRADRPANGSALIRWWKGFESVPPCDIRDRHIPFIRWLCGEPFSKDHERVWPTTFGTVELQHRAHQPSDTSVVVSQVPIDWSGSTQINTIGHHGGHHQDQDQDQDQDQAEREHEREGYPQPPPEPPLLPLAEGTNPGVARAAAPALNARSMMDALAASAGGRVSFDLVDDRLLPQLESVAAQCATGGVTLADLDLAGRFLRAGGLAYRSDLGASWAARPGSVMDLVSNARRWQKGEVRIDPRDARAAAGEDEPSEPRPISAFTTGIRAL